MPLSSKPRVYCYTCQLSKKFLEVRKMENMGIQKLTEELKRLNPSIDVCFKADIYPAIIIVGCSDCAQLNLPAGYYCNGKNGLTNKHNTTSGQCESFELMTRYEYLAMLA